MYTAPGGALTWQSTEQMSRKYTHAIYAQHLITSQFRRALNRSRQPASKSFNGELQHQQLVVQGAFSDSTHLETLKGAGTIDYRHYDLAI
jgi:hypothetical protein